VNINKYLVFDFEAASDWGLEIWHPEYRVTSCDFLFVDGGRRKLKFTKDLGEMKKCFKAALAGGYQFVCHNYAYEYSVLKRVFDITLPATQVIDTMRLHSYATKRCGAQAKRSLVAAVEEYFNVIDYKDEYHQTLIDTGVAKNKKEAKGKVGELPEDLLERYNRADIEYTEKVFIHCVDDITSNGLDVEQDLFLYNRKVMRNMDAWLRGVKIDRNVAENNLKSLEDEYKWYIEQFYTKYSEEIAQAEELIRQANTGKSFKYRVNKAVNPEKIKIKEAKPHTLNLGSTADLAVLFVDVFNLKPKVFTEGGAPSFKKDYLSQWGEKADLMLKWKKLVKPISELKAVLEHSSVDGRVHFYVSPFGTVTGRGSSGRN